jgi:molybdenum cofactor cytidylyltransferase
LWLAWCRKNKPHLPKCKISGEPSMLRIDSPTSAVILAAGTSTRMGTVKQLLSLDCRPLLQHVLDNVRASGVKEIILVLGFSAEAIRREIEAENVRVVVNQNYQRGMGTSLRAGLSAVDQQAEGALIVLADQPFVRPATLDHLIAEHQRSKPQIVIPTYRGFRGNPVLLDRSVFPEVMALDADMGCRAIFGDHPHGILKVPVDDVGILLDIDRKSDFDALGRVGSRAEREKKLLETADLHGRQTAGVDGAKPELIIVGRDAMAAALAKLGRLLQFTVTVVDPLLASAELPDADRVLHSLDFSVLPASSDRHVVVASRGTCDEEAIEQALEVNASYIALVAKKKRGEEVFRGLRMKGTAPEKLARVRVPAGLEIGAETPEEIAVSITAEIVSERRKRAKKI